MKVMKHSVIVALAMLMASCAAKNNTNQESADEAASANAAELTSTVICRTDDGSQLIWVKDNEGDKKMDRKLFPDASDELISELGFADGVPSSISVFYIENNDEWMLFDAGLGKNMGGKAMTDSVAGLDRSKVKTVFLTHFHLDHIGGMLVDGEKTYPDAKVYVCKNEYDYWMKEADEESSKMQRDVMTKYNDNLVFFNWGDELPAGVKAIEAPGHTPGHTVFQKSNVLIIGDLMHGYDLQKDHPEISCNFDMDKTLAAESRVKILNYAKENNLVMVGMHQPAPAACEK